MKCNQDVIIGEEFDTYDDTWICKKYIPKGSEKKTSNNTIRAKKKITELIVENQFRLHRDTEQFKKNLNRFNPEDIVSITYKLHGTSAVFSNVLVKRILNPFEKFLRFFKVNIQETKYGNVYSSIKVIKDVDGKTVSEKGFYEEDIWKIVNEEIKDNILQGISLYGEIVGYLPSGKMIQEQYDYGCNKPVLNTMSLNREWVPNSYVLGREYDFYVYRITYTNPEGHVFEFNWQDIKDYCNKYGLKHVPEMYYGILCSYVGFEGNTLNVYNEDEWSSTLLRILTEDYLEKDCSMCRNNVPAEGICIRKESGDKEAYKLKSFRFLKQESDNLDKNIVDIESKN